MRVCGSVCVCVCKCARVCVQFVDREYGLPTDSACDTKLERNIQTYKYVYNYIRIYLFTESFKIISTNFNPFSPNVAHMLHFITANLRRNNTKLTNFW